jgi:hypothetical protein
MKVSELIEMLLDVDPDIEVMMEVGKHLITVCRNSEVEEIPVIPEEMSMDEAYELDDEDLQFFEKHKMLVLVPCTCSTDVLEEEDNTIDHFPIVGDVDSAERLN